MKPVAVINVEKLVDGDIDQAAKLHNEGYVVILAHEGPSITLHQAPPDRRERIATAVLAGLYANQGVDLRYVEANTSMALTAADALIGELNK